MCECQSNKYAIGNKSLYKANPKLRYTLVRQCIVECQQVGSSEHGGGASGTFLAGGWTKHWGHGSLHCRIGVDDNLVS